MKDTFLALLLGAFVFVQPAFGQDVAPLENYFFSTNSCYGRSYSGEHLRDQAKQQVIEMAISHFPSKQELLGMESSFQPYPDTPRLALRLDVWLRGQDKGWQEHAICEPSGQDLKCGFECDGGSFVIKGREKARLLISLEDDLSFNQCDTGVRTLRRSKQDNHFLLYPIPMSHCLPD
ncbi:MAG: hypothetical protein ABJY83_24460 [Roseibium sp.]